MARYDHVVRVVRFLERLEDSRAGLTLRSAAEELGVSERTARRYIEALRRADYCVDDEAGRYRMPRRAGALDKLTEADRRQMVMSAIAAWPLRGTPFSPDPTALNERLFPTPRQRELFARLQMPLTTPHRLAIDYRRHEGVLRNFLKAIDEKQVVHAEYFTAGRNEWTVRDIDPYTFHYDPALETIYVLGYCHWRKEVRTFAAHRFRNVRPTRRTFQIDSSFSVEKHLAGAFRVYRGKQAIEVVLRFSAAVAPRVAERLWHASQRQKAIAGGALELSFTLDGEEEIRAFILSYGADVRVEAPGWLAERIVDECARLLSQYEGHVRIGAKRAAK